MQTCFGVRPPSSLWVPVPLKKAGAWPACECVQIFVHFSLCLIDVMLGVQGLTSWSRDSENPIEKFSTFFARWSFITALIRDATWLCPEPDESSPHLRTPLLIPSFHLRLDLPGSFRFRFSVWNVGITSIRCEFPYWQSYSSLSYHFIFV
jgi:hypothetical protein